MQFFLNLWTMLLLRYFGLTFFYSLFHIVFFSYSSASWSEEMIYLVFGSGPLLLSVAGVILLLLLKNLNMASWKTKLTLTWLAFLFIHALPCGILAGTLFFDEFGMALFWIVNSFMLRGILAIMVLVILVFLSRFWYRMFLKASYTKAFFDGSDAQRRFLISVFIKPWFFGFIILLGFNWPFHNWYWPVFLLSLGYMAVTLIGNRVINPKPKIKKSDKQIFTSRIQLFSFTIVLILIWAVGNIRVKF